MISDPSKHNVHPTLPMWPSSSLSKNDAKTALVDRMSMGSALGHLDFDAYPISTLSAPNGVTNIGGANVYAAKLATGITVRLLARFGSSDIPSPITTTYHCQLRGLETPKGRSLTCYYSRPPDWILEV